MAEHKPLTPDQHRAADMLGRNWTVKKVADEVGVTPKTVGQRWMKRADFAALVAEKRAALLDTMPSAKATLEAALNATENDGIEWAIRVKAAQLLLTTADPDGAPDPEGGRQPTYIYISPDEDGSGASDPR